MIEGSSSRKIKNALEVINGLDQKKLGGVVFDRERLNDILLDHLTDADRSERIRRGHIRKKLTKTALVGVTIAGIMDFTPIDNHAIEKAGEVKTSIQSTLADSMRSISQYPRY